MRERENLFYVIVLIKTIISMPLMYSVGARKNPLDKDAAPQFYATAQVAQIIEVRDLCKSCRAHSTFTMGDSMGVI